MNFNRYSAAIKTISVLALSGCYYDLRSPESMEDTSAVSEPDTDSAEDTATDTGEEPAMEPSEDSAEPSAEPSEDSAEPSAEPDSAVDAESTDDDGDGFSELDGDCDDTDILINPDAEEICDEVDNDCDGDIDNDDPDTVLPTWYLDLDGDGYGSIFPWEDCNQDPNMVDNNDDCDDTNPDVNPGALDIPLDGVDQDCSGSDAETYPDTDGDGFNLLTDCDDSNPWINPDAKENPFDGLDSDCDGVIGNTDHIDYYSSLVGDSGDYLSFDSAISLADFTQDGIPELIVGASLANNYRGYVALFDGADSLSWDGPANDNAFARIESQSDNTWIGSLSRTQGDLNNDGFLDLVIAGSDLYSVPGLESPAISVFLDPASLSGIHSTTDAQVRIYGAASNHGNTRVSADLDFNGDNHDDVFFGDFLETSINNQQDHIVNGSSSLFYFSGDMLNVGSHDLQTDKTTRMYTNNPWDYLGSSISGGDMDGDGDSELIISIPGYDSFANDAGCVFLFHGGSFSGQSDDSLIEHDLFTLFNSGAAICSSTMNAQLGWGGQSKIADLNGDGEKDLVISAPAINTVYVFHSAKDLVGIVIPENDADTIITSGGSPDWFGYSIEAGDFDGDGIEDLVVGAPDIQEPINTSGGGGGMIYNQDTLLSTASPNVPGKIYYYKGSNLSGSMSDSHADGVINGLEPDLFGMHMVAGDMNGDGKTDLWVGSPRFDGDRGRVALFMSP